MENDIFRATQREIAEMAECNRKTACLSLSRLCDEGLLVKIEPEEGVNSEDGANHYSLGTDKIIELGAQLYEEAEDIEVRKKFINHDIWQWGALGRSCQIIYGFLQDEELYKTAKGLAVSTGYSLKTVNRNLKKLVVAGLAYQEGPFWFPEIVSLERLDELAFEYGATGIMDQRKKRHIMDREEQALKFLMKGQKKTTEQPKNYNHSQKKII